MPTPATAQLPPPNSWDEFEDLCADLFQEEWRDWHVVRHGREGQRQDGVDIYGRPNGADYSGVQCKGKKLFPPKKLKISDIDGEVEKAS
jgi:hypothetical protein